MRSELGQAWVNIFGNHVPVLDEEEGQILARIEKGSQLSFGRFSVMLEQVQNSIGASVKLDFNLVEDGSLYLCVVKEVPLKDAITDIKEEEVDAPVEEAPKKRGRKKAEVEDAVPAEKGE